MLADKMLGIRTPSVNFDTYDMKLAIENWNLTTVECHAGNRENRKKEKEVRKGMLSDTWYVH